MATVGTMGGVKLYMCATAQTSTLNQAAFEALTWVEIKKVGDVSGVGTTANVLTYNTLGDDVSQKGKGVRNGGDWNIELARVYNDTGQDALRVAADSNLDYAFKLEYSDSPDGIMTNTIIYNRGIVNEQATGSGRREDFVLERYILGMQQKNIRVDPA